MGLNWAVLSCGIKTDNQDIWTGQWIGVLIPAFSIGTPLGRRKIPPKKGIYKPIHCRRIWGSGPMKHSASLGSCYFQDCLISPQLYLKEQLVLQSGGKIVIWLHIHNAVGSSPPPTSPHPTKQKNMGLIAVFLSWAGCRGRSAPNATSHHGHFVFQLGYLCEI